MRRRDPVLTLIEEQTRLLAAAEIDVVLDACLGHADAVGHVAGDDVDPLLESLEQARPRVVARDDAARL